MLDLVFSNAFERANSIYCPTFCCSRRGYVAPESMTLGNQNRIKKIEAGYGVKEDWN
jgi:hypothetical protein